MGLYLYCLGTPAHPPPVGVAGIGGAPVRATQTGGLVAWVSDMDAAPAPSLESVREHNRVVERACERETALPLRFGQWFPDAPALAAAIAERRDRLEAGLARVSGALEMGVRVMDPSQADPAPDRSTGRAYLEGLARRAATTEAARARGTAVAAELREWLGDFVRDQQVRPLGSAGGLAAVAHLVDRHDIGGYNARLREFPARHADLRFLFSGPWPPYGFVDEERQDG